MRKVMDFLMFNEVLKNFIEQQKFHQFCSCKIAAYFIFCPKNDGVVAIFFFSASEALKKGPNFGFLTLKYAFGIGPSLYGKSVLYLMDPSTPQSLFTCYTSL